MPQGNHQRVLYIDDEEMLVRLATRMLNRLGYEVTGFSDAYAALRAFRDAPQNFDIVVTDLTMPRLSGFELAQELLSTRADIPVVMTSGNVVPEEETLALNLGVREVLPKPHTLEDIARALDRQLHHVPEKHPNPLPSS